MGRKATLTLILVLASALVLAACSPGGGDSGPAYSPDMVAAGEVEYQKTCSACHAADATGIDNLGKALVGSEFVNERTDAELLEYVKLGRAVDDPLNSTGIAMPPKGGNPALTDDQIMSIIAYLRSIQS